LILGPPAAPIQYSTTLFKSCEKPDVPGAENLSGCRGNGQDSFSDVSHSSNNKCAVSRFSIIIRITQRTHSWHHITYSRRRRVLYGRILTPGLLAGRKANRRCASLIRMCPRFTAELPEGASGCASTKGLEFHSAGSAHFAEDLGARHRRGGCHVLSGLRDGRQGPVDCTKSACYPMKTCRGTAELCQVWATTPAIQVKEAACAVLVALRITVRCLWRPSDGLRHDGRRAYCLPRSRRIKWDP